MLTRSRKYSTMPIKDELKDYFEKLVKPLVTNANMEEILGKFKREVISKFEETITEQEKRITRLKSTLALRENTIDVLLLSKLEVKADDNEQYSRRSCLRIHGATKIWKIFCQIAMKK